jgi:SAM-dependent methyltransferase
MTTEAPASALERTIELLDERAAARARERGLNQAGYLDLLEEELESTGATQDLMVTRLVPAIYERYWRPALGRVAKGITGPGMAEEVRIARLLLGLGAGDRVLDIACGPGNFTRDFARAVGDSGLAVGADGSRPMLERAVREAEGEGLPSLAFVHCDATVLPFRDASFDAVCCFAALNLFAEPFAALDEMRRVLSRGGRIALFTSARGTVGPVRLVEAALAAPAGIRMFDRDEIVDALRERGFADIRQRITGLTQFVGGRLP